MLRRVLRYRSAMPEYAQKLLETGEPAELRADKSDASAYASPMYVLSAGLEGHLGLILKGLGPDSARTASPLQAV